MFGQTENFTAFDRNLPGREPTTDRDPSRDLWEQYAEWWIDNFTGGADAEYEEQILPVRGARAGRLSSRVLDIGCGDGQISRLLAANGARVVGIDPTWNQIVVAAPARRRAGLRPGRPPTGCRSPTPASTPCSPASCSSTSTPSTRRSARSPVSSRPGGRFSFFVNHPLLQTPGSGFIDDHMIDPPEQYWRVGPYLVEGESIEQVEQGVYIRFIHRPLSRYVNTMLDHGFELQRMVEPAPPPGFLDAGARVPRRGDDPAPHVSQVETHVVT